MANALSPEPSFQPQSSSHPTILKPSLILFLTGGFIIYFWDKSCLTGTPSTFLCYPVHLWTPTHLSCHLLVTGPTSPLSLNTNSEETGPKYLFPWASHLLPDSSPSICLSSLTLQNLSSWRCSSSPLSQLTSCEAAAIYFSTLTYLSTCSTSFCLGMAVTKLTMLSQLQDLTDIFFFSRLLIWQQLGLYPTQICPASHLLLSLLMSCTVLLIKGKVLLEDDLLQLTSVALACHHCLYVQCSVMLESSHRQCPDCSHPSSSSPSEVTFLGLLACSVSSLLYWLITPPHSFLGNSHCFIPSSLKTTAQWASAQSIFTHRTLAPSIAHSKPRKWTNLNKLDQFTPGQFGD